MHTGEPIHGELHSADASAGVALLLYKSGSLAAYTLGVDEYIEIHSIDVVSAAGGDTVLYFSADGTVVAGGVIVRGTLAVNSGIVMSRMNAAGTIGKNVYVKTPMGAADANFIGVIKRATANDSRPSWRESLVPGH